MDAPRENLLRGYPPGLQQPRTEQRAADEGDPPEGDRTLYGHFTPFNQWSEIDSMFEGRFLEQIAPGAFRKTFKERGDQVKVMFNHGHSQRFEDLPLGTISLLREEGFGPYYEVDLFDTPDIRDELVPRLRAEVLGASFMFNVLQERWDDEPEQSDHNPLGLPERTITEVRLHEFGPVVWPAYEAATAKVRSLTDHFRSLATPDNDEPPSGTRQVDEPVPPTDEAAQPEHFRGSTPAQLSTRLMLLSTRKD